MFPTADLHTQTHILTVTQSTHTWTAQAWAPRSPLQTSNTHTGAPRVGKQGRNKEKETQGHQAQTQGPKGGFGYIHLLEVNITISITIMVFFQTYAYQNISSIQHND